MQLAIHFAPYLIRAEIKLFSSRSLQTSYQAELQAVTLRLGPRVWTHLSRWAGHVVRSV
jgi:hypothetical protein